MSNKKLVGTEPFRKYFLELRQFFSLVNLPLLVLVAILCFGSIFYITSNQNSCENGTANDYAVNISAGLILTLITIGFIDPYLKNVDNKKLVASRLDFESELEIYLLELKANIARLTGMDIEPKIFRKELAGVHLLHTKLDKKVEYYIRKTDLEYKNKTKGNLEDYQKSIGELYDFLRYEFPLYSYALDSDQKEFILSFKRELRSYLNNIEVIKNLTGPIDLFPYGKTLRQLIDAIVEFDAKFKKAA